MRSTARVARLESIVARSVVPSVGAAVPARDPWAEILSLVPAEFRGALAAKLGGPYDADLEALTSWAAAPVAPWARPPAAGVQVPEALVAWVLDPPHRYWVGHHCGACGLAVPVGLDRPARPFPTCPACGKPTSFAAYYRPDPEAKECGSQPG
ncbi:unnamed protein product [Gemmataceae bacterium]|nr:unnamed protein product [Gemmataceae bacterium]VTU02488.1 unnamed protein product [Gemmataceae bacterium]